VSEGNDRDDDDDAPIERIDDRASREPRERMATPPPEPEPQTEDEEDDGSIPLMLSTRSVRILPDAGDSSGQLPASDSRLQPAIPSRRGIPRAPVSDSTLEPAVASRRSLVRKSTVPPPTKPAPPMAGVRWDGDPGATTRRIGAIGTLVAALLVFIAVFADMLASDFPVACKVDGRLFLFPNVTQSATGIDVSRASWKIDALVPYGPTTKPAPPLARPGAQPGHPFGTDRLGRDVFARVVHGTRSYLVFALAAVAASLALGVLFGALAGLFGGPTDALVSRAIESISAFPPLVLVLGVQAAVPTPTLMTLFLAIALSRWPEIARLVRGEVILASTRDYALAARALGASPLRILRKHIMPNVRGPLIVAAAIGVSAVVLTEASLDFLRVGPPGGAASWGETMSEFRDAPGAWWLLAFPGVLIVATVLALTTMGEALRDHLDPRS
jgi:peptide/nickel transport system permease protein